MTAREELVRLVDELPESDLATAKRLLRGLVLTHEAEAEAEDPLIRALANAPLDGEPETDEERRAVAESWVAYERGDGIPHEEMLRRTRAKAA